jgi:hypothetical protein
MNQSSSTLPEQKLAATIPSVGVMLVNCPGGHGSHHRHGHGDVLGLAQTTGWYSSPGLEGYIGPAIVFVAQSLALQQTFGYIEKKVQWNFLPSGRLGRRFCQH